MNIAAKTGVVHFSSDIITIQMVAEKPPAREAEKEAGFTPCDQSQEKQIIR